MNKTGILFSIHESITGECIDTMSVTGETAGAVLEEIAKIVSAYEDMYGGKDRVVVKTLKACLNEDVIVTPEKLDNVNTMLSLAVEHYQQRKGEVLIESCAPERNLTRERLTKVLSSPKKTKKLLEAAKKLKELDLPSLDKGDTLLVGKFKNRKAEITGFDKDDNNQPVAKTTKGDQKIFKPRIAKLMPESSRIFLVPGGGWEHWDLSAGDTVAEGKDLKSLTKHLENCGW